MYCPEGYKTIGELRSSVIGFEWSIEKYPYQTPSDAYENLVFKTILENDALRICSPTGTILKVSEEILDKIDMLDFFSPESFPISHFAGLVRDESGEVKWRGMPLFLNGTITPSLFLIIENTKRLLSMSIEKKSFGTLSACHSN